MANISKITPLGSSTTYDIAAWRLKNYNRLTDANITHITDGGMELFQATATMTDNKPDGNGQILHFHWDTSSSWDSQLFIPDGHSGSMQWRAHTSATDWGDGWKTLLDSDNYITYTVKKDGTGATGTWDISITGNAGTATKLATARSLKTKLDSTTAVTFDGSANQNAIPVTGTLPIGNGGTGATTANDAANNLISGLPTWTANPTDDTYFIRRDTGGGAVFGQVKASTIHGYLDTKHTWVRLAGDTMTGHLTAPSTNCTWIAGQNAANAAFNIGDATNTGSYWPWMRQTNTSSSKWFSFGTLGTKFYWIGSATSRTENGYDAGMSFDVANGYLQGCSRVYGAVWNDYAEYRKDNPKENQEPGRCVKELGDGSLALTTKRLERGCEIVSDTFGFAIGQNEENGYNTPIASNGRVLAYPYESIEEFTTHIGWPVCSGPNGTVSIMTEEEEEKYPSRIIGTISEIPNYEEWGTGKIKVNGRIWIRIK